MITTPQFVPEDGPASAEREPLLATSFLTETNRGHVAHVLRPGESTADPTVNEHSHLTAIGDRYLREGNFYSALEVYIAAGSKEHIITIGNLYLEQGHPGFAIEAYIAAGANDKLIVAGDYCLQQDLIDLAYCAYAAANQKLPEDKLLAHRKNSGS